ncbi:hypothetical protein DV451_000217 [Geotrichum candidum]|uniref:Aldehyde dehydrogenase domain-containing protein n=1 Tax=Geotrichum candidum TaxID=1173061 RepID=A0A9P5KX05_GEOCN|nr:hypothetical protein DV451_000217 [Geotrichum candidum]KAF5106241.1 hypothetical protein DV453_004093 [Geotrichum candidum]
MATSVQVTLPNGLTYEQPTGLFINNEFIPSSDGELIASINPSTEEVIAEVHAASIEDIDKAVISSRKAFKEVWKNYSIDGISRLLHKLADLFERDREILTSIEAADSGKPQISNASGDIDECVLQFRYYAGWADKRGGTVAEATSDKLGYIVHEPHGVCGQIIPWNYPLAMASWKIGPAIAAGNVIIIKLAENTPLSMLYVGKLIVEAGFPPGVINIVAGHGKIAGNAIATHPGIDKVAFTGSTLTGKSVMAAAAQTLKNVTLECGGKSPMIVFDDADIDQAVKWGHWGIMYNMGQNCSSTSRILIQDTIYDKFVDALVKYTKETYSVGDVYDATKHHGPVISKVQFDKILGYVESGKEQGATLAFGGKAPYEKGYFIEPTIFSDVTDEMKIWKEEIFGPVVCLSKFSTEEEALYRANDTTYGLGSAIFSADISRCLRVSRELDAGTVWINSSNDTSHRIPFGGFKMSGIGSELGQYGLDNYTLKKAIHVNIGSKL